MGDLPLRTPADRRHGGPSPRRQANPTRPHPVSRFMPPPCGNGTYRALILISKGCARARGRLDTRDSPIRRSPSPVASYRHAAPRLACVRPVASVHPDPGSNSPLLLSFSCFFSVYNKTPKKLSTEAPIPFRGSATPKSIAFIPVQRIIVTWTRLHSLA